MRTKTLPCILTFVGLIILAQGTTGWCETSLRQTIPPVSTGQTYVASLRLLRTPMSGRVQFTTVNKVAIFPLADYSHQQSFLRPLDWGANRAIIEAIADRFIARGIAVGLQEDVEGVLIADGLMRSPSGSHGDGESRPLELFGHRSHVVNTPEYELVWGFHDQAMRDELQGLVSSQDYFIKGNMALGATGEPFLQGITSGLSKERVIQLGRILDVDLIIRGRILEYGLKGVRPTSSVVQIRLYASETKTGELMWSNRAEMEVVQEKPASRTASDLKALLDRATREVVDTLMADFFGDR